MISVRKYIDKYAENHDYTSSHYDIFELVGYIPVSIERNQSWGELIDWLLKNIGWENFNITGTVFWFNTEHDAVMFALRWS